MKKYIAIIPVSFLLLLFISVVPVKAATPNDYTSEFPNHFYGRFYEPNVDRYTWIFVMSAGSMTLTVNSEGFTGDITQGSDWWQIQKVGIADCPSLNDSEWVHLYWNRAGYFSFGTVFDNVIAVGNITVNSTVPVYNSPYDYQESLIPTPPEPEPGSTWLSDMWEWILWQLGFNDDYSGDLVSITGGDKVRTEIVTPTPSPTPTPRPSPTPYLIQIVDPNTGNPVYDITGLPNQTIIINEGDDIDNGSDFDIFEVDQIIGDGGSVSPRDGINDVMETNNDYIQDMDISSVEKSFSVLPPDWLLLFGVLASLPFIAGFIAKLLK